MKKLLLTALLSAGMLTATAQSPAPGDAGYASP